jgi:hypothetical protein
MALRCATPRPITQRGLARLVAPARVEPRPGLWQWGMGLCVLGGQVAWAHCGGGLAVATRSDSRRSLCSPGCTVSSSNSVSGNPFPEAAQI